MRKVFTLCFIKKNNKILLGMKKRGFGEGKWNGFGGKVEDGESIEDGAKREFEEECGLRVSQLKEVGIINFNFLDSGQELEVHIFVVENYSGKVIETEEMFPKWFDFNDIPFDNMWLDDPFWLPMFLDDKHFKGVFVFKNQDKIDNYELSVIEEK
ncbi:MAG: 8-oxo-dGTP diphosphatase [Candidatus Paceibacterota bacterium]|jgi:8-oxo-dGTP diphosphatase/2-hydroxy-dATP diphosphatase|nr:8-oxo-dGTP diphosphatase [bacterium]